MENSTLELTAALILAGAHLAVAAETTLTPNLSGFSRVEAERAFEVEIHRGDTFRVEIHADDTLAKDLDIHTTGDKLTLTARDRHVWRNNERARAVITMPALQEFHGSGATRTTIEGFHASTPMDIQLSGASTIEATLDSGDLHVELSGASKAKLRGKGANLRAEASGASQADLGGFPVDRAEVHLSGASRATVNTHGRLDIHASGASHITHFGHPSMGTVESSGASSIRAAD